ncbi:hypothetical protein KUTeg_021344 [Tegillarca granosa]|uniref:Uncharacterized protein n=1 Tax=Tegillarca granosa TaxID=220873 RepID=A0ABQ9EEM2_TEGGR|nr:hypothetical protein KUTeg_021344 [Tegillarca granosa]
MEYRKYCSSLPSLPPAVVVVLHTDSQVLKKKELNYQQTGCGNLCDQLVLRTLLNPARSNNELAQPGCWFILLSIASQDRKILKLVLQIKVVFLVMITEPFLYPKTIKTLSIIDDVHDTCFSDALQANFMTSRADYSEWASCHLTGHQSTSAGSLFILAQFALLSSRCFCLLCGIIAIVHLSAEVTHNHGYIILYTICGVRCRMHHNISLGSSRSPAIHTGHVEKCFCYLAQALIQCPQIMGVFNIVSFEPGYCLIVSAISLYFVESFLYFIFAVVSKADMSFVFACEIARSYPNLFNKCTYRMLILIMSNENAIVNPSEIVARAFTVLYNGPGVDTNSVWPEPSVRDVPMISHGNPSKAQNLPQMVPNMSYLAAQGQIDTTLEYYGQFKNTALPVVNFIDWKRSLQCYIRFIGQSKTQENITFITGTHHFYQNATCTI